VRYGITAEDWAMRRGEIEAAFLVRR